jgi:hypothetical protein
VEPFGRLSIEISSWTAGLEGHSPSERREISKCIIIIKASFTEKWTRKEKYWDERHEIFVYPNGSNSCVKRFQDLRQSWARLRQCQMKEYQRLGISTVALAAKNPRRPVPSAQLSEPFDPTGSSETLSTKEQSKPTHSSIGISKKAALKNSNRLFRRSSRKRSRSSESYGKICLKVEHDAQSLPEAQSDRRRPLMDKPTDKPPPWRRLSDGERHDRVCNKVEHEAQDLPDEQSDRRGPPTDRPPDKRPPWKGAFAGSLYERASSRHASQLASSRGNTGLSGNASPLQKCN